MAVHCIVPTCGSATGDLWYCAVCQGPFCDRDWNYIPMHILGQLGPDGMPHEKVKPSIYQHIERCMAPPIDERDQNQQHKNDGDTEWFGFDRENGNPVLAEYRRYAALMLTSAEAAANDEVQTDANGGSRYPALVSFIGQTGGGKSSLIKLLIGGPSTQADSTGSSAIATPVIGRAGSGKPTSADVHLYIDPQTSNTVRPILYADCEGFEGGESDPVATVALSQDTQSVGPEHAVPTRSPEEADDSPMRKLKQGIKRTLKWATRDSVDHEKTSKRGYAVSEMYPRIFYAFSDVIVFVVTNERTIEVVIEKLLQWADTNHSGSINTPSKPHAIIAINKCGNSTAMHQWPSNHATADMLKVKIDPNEDFRRHAQKWQALGHDRIFDIESLLKCYYSTVHVVRLPHKNRPQRMHDQREELYRVITDCCNKSKETKEDRRMLADADDFGLQLSLAFDHFSESLEIPFDYADAVSKHHPAPVTLVDNFTQLAISIQQQGQITIDNLFNELKPMIASCIMLDAARNRKIGLAEVWFKHKPLLADKTSGPSYEEQCQETIKDYMERYIRCEFQWKGRKCRLYKNTHGDMHKDKGFLHRPVDTYGHFVSSFNLEQYAWHKSILEDLKLLEKDSRWDTRNGSSGRCQAHQDTIQNFYKDRSGPLFSNALCLCCLANPPAYHLRCGHMLCTPCGLEFGTLESTTSLRVDVCPLHKEARRETSSPVPSVIPLEPQFSGLRVLCLDGGGIRGIVELCVMEAIEKRLGKLLPLHHFFDLIVGTSTGGIIALAFGHNLWTIEKCKQEFVSLVKKAFSERKFQKRHPSREIQFLIHRSTYESKPLDKALKEAFGEGVLLGAKEAITEKSTQLKVAVTACSATGDKAYLLSNYNTINCASSTPYTRFRSQSLAQELKVWEAARSTSAAPGYFKSYIRIRSTKDMDVIPEFIDGGLLHNNPIRVAIEESRRLAGTSGQMPEADLILSIGTGKPYKSHLAKKIPELRSPKKQNWVKIMFTMVHNQILLNIAAEDRWLQVFAENKDSRTRMLRFDADLSGVPPDMDDVDQVGPLQDKVARWLAGAPQRKEVSGLACMLVASSFYFERSGNIIAKPSSTEFPGHIKCRLSGDKDAVRGLAQFLGNCTGKAVFVGVNNESSAKDQRFDIDLKAMKEKGEWNDVKVGIQVTKENEKASTDLTLEMKGQVDYQTHFSISGFPRQLLMHDFHAQAILRRPGMHSEAGASPASPSQPPQDTQTYNLEARSMV